MRDPYRAGVDTRTNRSLDVGMAPRRKTTVELDLDALAAAEAALGTKGIKQTIDVALREAARQAALQRGAAYLAEGRQQLPDPLEWAAARDPRV